MDTLLIPTELKGIGFIRNYCNAVLIPDPNLDIATTFTIIFNTSSRPTPRIENNYTHKPNGLKDFSLLNMSVCHF
jgi:hypothetical protein